VHVTPAIRVTISELFILSIPASFHDPPLGGSEKWDLVDLA